MAHYYENIEEVKERIAKRKAKLYIYILSIGDLEDRRILEVYSDMNEAVSDLEILLVQGETVSLKKQEIIGVTHD